MYTLSASRYGQPRRGCHQLPPIPPPLANHSGSWRDCVLEGVWRGWRGSLPQLRYLRALYHTVAEYYKTTLSLPVSSCLLPPRCYPPTYIFILPASALEQQLHDNSNLTTTKSRRLTPPSPSWHPKRELLRKSNPPDHLILHPSP